MPTTNSAIIAGMLPALERHCEAFFSEELIAAGRKLLLDHALSIQSFGIDGVKALVKAEGRSSLEVCLTFECLPGEQLLGACCECREFHRGQPCKHLWALIAACSPSIEFPGEMLDFRIMPVYEAEVELGEPVALQLGLVVGENEMIPRASRRDSSTAVSLANANMKPWRKQLLSVATLSAGQEIKLPVLERLENANPTQHWFVIPLDALVPEDRASEKGLIVRLYRSSRKHNGQWSKPQLTSCSPSDIQMWSDSFEKAALTLLVPEKDNRHSPSRFRYSGMSSHHVTCSEFSVQPEIAAMTLRALSATGRLAWSLAAEQGVLDPQTLHFAGGADVRLHVRIGEQVTADGKTKLVVEPTLRREQEVIPIADVLAIAEGGVVVRKEDILLMPPHQVPLARSWQKIGRIEVPPRSLLTVIDEAAKWSGIDLEIDPNLPLTQSRITPRPRLHLSSPTAHDRFVNPQDLLARIWVVYGDYDIEIESPLTLFWDRATTSVVRRDHQTEVGFLQSLPTGLVRPTLQGQLLINRKQLPTVVTELSKAGWEVVADGNVVRRAGNFNITVDSGQDWFDLNASADFDGQQASLPELLAALRKGQDFVVLDDGSHGMLPTEWLKQFAGFDKTGQVEDDSIRFTKTQALLLDALLSAQENVTLDKAFRAWCEKLNSFSGIAPAAAPAGFCGKLRDYQRLGLGWFQFLQEFRLGGCLADDMGLGKTIQVLAMLEDRRAQTPSGQARRQALIVVPKSLIFNWIQEASKFAPQLRFLNYTGSQRNELQKQIANYDAIVTTYGTMRIDIDFLRKQSFDYVILDEAQAIKNPSSQAAKASRLLSGEHRLAMTGTPVENHLGDLWSLFDFLNPGMLGQTIGTAGGTQAENGDRLQQISQSLRPFILRRTKSQVLTELPAKSEQTLFCDMSSGQRKLYDDLKNHYRRMLLKKIDSDGLAKSKIVVLEALLRLRQAACDPRLVNPKAKVAGAKIGRLVEQLEEVVGEGHKALIFSQFTSLLSLVRQELDKRKYTYEYLDGKTTKRQQHVERFQNDPACPLFLISLKAGGHGLNLTAADYVFIMDPWWNPAVEAQAIDRAHRMGQTKPVLAYRMICRDTVEEKIVDLQASKRKLADAIISQEKSLVSELTRDDLRMLFS